LSFIDDPKIIAYLIYINPEDQILVSKKNPSEAVARYNSYPAYAPAAPHIGKLEMNLLMGLHITSSHHRTSVQHH
jgi:hypothetical protein